MADEANRAEEYQEIALDAAIQAARGIKPQPGLTCRSCGEALQDHRTPYGICWDCQLRIEAAHRRCMWVA